MPTNRPIHFLRERSKKDILPYSLGTVGRPILWRISAAACSRESNRGRKFLRAIYRSWDPKFQPRDPPYLAAVDRLADTLKTAITGAFFSFAIRWILDRGDTMTALWGKISQTTGRCAGAFGWKLTAEDYAQVDRILQETITIRLGQSLWLRAPRRKKQIADSKAEATETATSG